MILSASAELTQGFSASPAADLTRKLTGLTNMILVDFVYFVCMSVTERVSVYMCKDIWNYLEPEHIYRERRFVSFTRRKTI